MPRSDSIASIPSVASFAGGASPMAPAAAAAPSVNPSAVTRALATQRFHSAKHGTAQLAPGKVSVPKSADEKYVKLGIMGGMGPVAGLDAAMKAVVYCQKEKGAAKDQQVIPFTLSSDSSSIQDRTGYLLKAVLPLKTEAEKAKALIADVPDNPFAGMLKSLLDLQNSGARVIVITCNTAHAWFKSLQAHLNEGVHLLHIADGVVRALDKDPVMGKMAIKASGLMATTGTLNCGIYQERMQALDRKDVQFVTPKKEVQEHDVMGGIYGLPGDAHPGGVKGGNMEVGAQRLLAGAEALHHDGVKAISLSCTEIPLVIKGDEPQLHGMLAVDATQALMEYAVDTAQEIATSEREAVAAASEASAKAKASSAPTSLDMA